MKTSLPLFNEFGDQIHNFYLAFIAEPAPPEAGEPRKVVSLLVVDGSAHLFTIRHMGNFVQFVDKPFEIDTEDVVYINSECYYEDDVLAAIIQKITDEHGINVNFVTALPDQLEGFGLGLSGEQRRAFQLGHPIWRRGALSSTGGQGNKGCFSREALALRDTMQSWTIIGEQVIRYAFKRAQKEKLAFNVRHKDVSASAKNMIKLALGYYASDDKDQPFDVVVNLDGYFVLSLERFKHNSTYEEAQNLRFLRPKSPTISYYAPQSQTQEPCYLEMPGVIRNIIRYEMKSFSAFHPDCRFDALALAQWTSRILISLRIAYSAVLGVDRKRSDKRKELLNARTELEKISICRDFAFEPTTSLTGFLKSESGGTTEVSTNFSLDELLGLQEAVVIALLADIDPRAIHVRPTELPPPYLDALLGTARWLGQLYRGRYGVLNVPQATRLKCLAAPRDLEPEAAAALRMGVATMMSFLTPEGQSRLWEGAATVVDSGSARSVFVIDPRPRGTPAQKSSALASLTDKNGWSATASLPDPILVPGGYLLVPGDFAQEWQGQCADLMASLVMPTERK